jgi:hypothetical protein
LGILVFGLTRGTCPESPVEVDCPESPVEVDVDEDDDDVADDELLDVVPHTISDAIPAVPKLRRATVVVRLAASCFPVVLMSMLLPHLLA